MAICINLLSYERTLLAMYLGMSRAERDATLERAIRDPKTSGPLIEAYRYLLHA